MLNTPDILIDNLQEEATALEESDRQADALRAQLTANVLSGFREALIKIARCQAGIASHHAHEALASVGYCGHSGAVYKAALSGSANCYTCPSCGKAGPDRLEPYR